VSAPHDDITIAQAKAIGDHLMPRFELAMQQKLQPIEERLAAIEGVCRVVGRAYHAVTAAVTFVTTVVGGWILKDRQ
jgi:hypothetical protein